MTISITIVGADAGEVLHQLVSLAAGGSSLPAPAPYFAPNVGGEPEVGRTDVGGPDHRETSEAVTGNELDSAGVPFDPEVHTGTKLKDGTWRAKKGMADKAAELAAAAEPEPEEPSQSADDAGEETANDAVESSDDEDEFAAFANAGAAVEQPVVSARTWTDADIASLINQAANKIGGARVEEIKAVIANYTPEGVVPHSRHVPVDRREDFAREIEELAEIEFAG